MDREMQKWALIGAMLGIIVVVFGLMFMAYTLFFSHTPEQKAEQNAMNAVNCTKCMAERHINCTAETVQYSPWGAVCESKYVDKNCTTCVRV
jgi:uncharacterized membrane protein